MMFLALNEIRHSKLRYSLVIGVMFLIAYLVFFLTGLSYGLAQEFQMSIDKWQADNVILTSVSNDNLNMSMITQKEFDAIKATDKAGLVQKPGILVKGNDQDDKVNVTFFGIDKEQFIAPNIIEGKMFSEKNEAAADESVKKQYNIKLGDTVSVAGTDEKVKIVGFTDKASYSASPVLYVSYATTTDLGGAPTKNNEQIYNAVVTRGTVKDLPKGLEKLTIATFINKLPGYNAQVLTFSFMIGFLVVIAAVVIGIFVYVLTMQKINIFGVMKAQGISSAYIARSVIAQTFFLAVVGVVVGLLATLGSALVLPQAVPFLVNTMFFVGVSVLMVVIAILGAVFSVRTIVKIDPLKAIG